jgi:hypothetical protein
MSNLTNLINLGKTIEEYSLALEEFAVGQTEKLINLSLMNII